MNRLEYTVRLSGALRRYNLTHALHDVMSSIVRLQHAQGYATIPRICNDLSCTYQCVMQHFLKNPALFTRHQGTIPSRYTLTAEAVALMQKISQRIESENHPSPDAECQPPLGARSCS